VVFSYLGLCEPWLIGVDVSVTKI
jgi:hypothetical protein